MSYNLKELAKYRDKHKKEGPFLFINESGKTNIAELIQREKKYKISIDDIGKLAEEAKHIILTFQNTKTEVWECSKCTFVNINSEDNCIMCNCPQNMYTISNLVNNFNPKGYLYGHDNILDNDILQGMYFLQNKDIPSIENVIELLNLVKKNQQKSNLFIVIYNNGKIVSYKLNPKLLEWLDKFEDNQDKDNFILLNRDITIYEKNKFNEIKELDIELFCYPTRIK